MHLPAGLKGKRLCYVWFPVMQICIVCWLLRRTSEVHTVSWSQTIALTLNSKDLERPLMAWKLYQTCQLVRK